VAVSLVETSNGRERFENSPYLKKDLVLISIKSSKDLIDSNGYISTRYAVKMG